MADLIMPSRRWDLQLLEQALCAEDCEVVSSISLGTVAQLDDSKYWFFFTRMGNIQSNLAIMWLRGNVRKCVVLVLVFPILGPNMHFGRDYGAWIFLIRSRLRFGRLAVIFYQLPRIYFKGSCCRLLFVHVVVSLVMIRCMLYSCVHKFWRCSPFLHKFSVTGRSFTDFLGFAAFHNFSCVELEQFVVCLWSVWHMRNEVVHGKIVEPAEMLVEKAMEGHATLKSVMLNRRSCVYPVMLAGSSHLHTPLSSIVMGQLARMEEIEVW